MKKPKYAFIDGKFGYSDMFKVFEKLDACKTEKDVHDVLEEVAAMNLKNSLTRFTIIKKAQQQIELIKGVN